MGIDRKIVQNGHWWKKWEFLEKSTQWSRNQETKDQTEWKMQKLVKPKNKRKWEQRRINRTKDVKAIIEKAASTQRIQSKGIKVSCMIKVELSWAGVEVIDKQ